MISWGVLGFVIFILFTFCYKCCCEPHPPLWRREQQSQLEDIVTL